jgi:hypothetical protein
MPIVPHAWRLHYLAPAVAVLGFVAAHGDREGAALGEDWPRFRGPNGSGVSRARLGHGAKYYASPVAAGGKLLLVDADGKVAVVTAQAQWEVLATSELRESCHATPAIANGRLYIRTENKLHCFAAGER